MTTTDDLLNFISSREFLDNCLEDYWQRVSALRNELVDMSRICMWRWYDDDDYPLIVEFMGSAAAGRGFVRYESAGRLYIDNAPLDSLYPLR